MIDYYGYETSPRKIEPEYIPEVKKNNKMSKTKQKTKTKTKTKTTKTKSNNNQSNKTKEKKNYFIKIVYIIGVFSILYVISYRYAIINARFNEKENLKTKLSEIQKLNQQLTVSIEQGMNINKIEQEAKEKLGMQKLDNNQKVYINLEKSDYTESSNNSYDKEEVETWWSKLLKDIFNIN